MPHTHPAIGFPQPREPFDRTFNSRGFKPAAMHQVRVGGWAEAYVGNARENFNGKRYIFGRVLKIAYLHQRIYFQIDDQAFSPEISGLEDGWTLEVELADLCASEFSPAQMEWEAECAMEEERRQLFERYQEEFLRRWSQFNLRNHANALTFDNEGWAQARRRFTDEVVEWEKASDFAFRPEGEGRPQPAEGPFAISVVGEC